MNIPGPLVSARFSVLRDEPSCCEAVCPVAWSCADRHRSRALLLRANGTVWVDAPQVALDLLRDGFMVLACCEAPAADERQDATFLTLICSA
jgi:hypothetical protein